jgi:hypothetical protein
MLRNRRVSIAPIGVKATVKAVRARPFKPSTVASAVSIPVATLGGIEPLALAGEEKRKTPPEKTATVVIVPKRKFLSFIVVSD